MAEKKSTTGDSVYVAVRTAHVDFEGRRTLIRKGTTRVAGGHELVKKFPDLFEEASSNLTFDVEDTVNRPGMVTRGSDGNGRARVNRTEAKPAAGSEAPNEPYAGQTAKDLKAEIAKRNQGRGDDDQIKVEKRATVPQLKALLAADDDATSAKAAQEAPEQPAEPVDKGEPPHKENQTDTTSPVKEGHSPDGGVGGFEGDGGTGDGNS